jgi:membrane protein
MANRCRVHPKPKAALTVAKETLRDFKEDGGAQAAAALAFYTVFALPPMLMLMITLLGWALGEDAVRGQIVGEMTVLIGREGAEVAQTMLENARRPGQGVLAAILGFGALLFGAFGVFRQLQIALNRMWEVAPRPVKGIWNTIRARVLSFSVVAGIFFLLMVSLVLSAALTALADGIGDLTGLPESVIHSLNAVVSFGVIGLMIAAIYKWLPDATVAWRDALAGAALTSLLLLVGKLLIGLYLAHAVETSAFGAAGSLAIVMLWVYWAAQILLIGAELTQIIAKRAGRRITPEDDAIAFEERPSAA